MLKHTIIISVLSILLAYYFGATISNLWFSNTLPENQITKEKLFTKSELQRYNGVKRSELYLSITGVVYDVTKGKKHYGPGETYNYFIGTDCTRGFVTGKCNGDLDEHVADLDFSDLRSINHWITFYDQNYEKVGKFIGKYHNENGDQTPYGKQVIELINRAEREKENEDMEKFKYPPCNIEWSQERGSRVWCTTKSGGVTRSWIGKPRKLFQPKLKDHRCACIHDDHLNLESIEEYEDCDSDGCYIKN